MTAPLYVLPDIAEARGIGARLSRRIGGLLDRVAQGLAARGVPPRLLGYRYRRRVPAAGAATTIRVVHETRTFRAAPPQGLSVSALPADPGWWGFSFRDVTARAVGPTRLLTVADGRVLALRSKGGAGDYTPAVLDSAGRGLDLREIRFRPLHAALAGRPPDLEMEDALWVAERVFDNYAHWFTAHLPKLVMLRDRDELAGLVLPAGRPGWVDESLARIGIGRGDFAELPAPGILRARRLRLVESDRFNPDLLRAARNAIAEAAPVPRMRIFVSRRRARGRTLLDEAALEPLLKAAGFNFVAMEDLTLGEQITLMAQTGTLLAPHGAGLTNMLFCAPGTRIVEIADPAYPNPNFYAMAAALGHDYRYVAATGVGEGHPLRQDLRVAEADLRAALDALP